MNNLKRDILILTIILITLLNGCLSEKTNIAELNTHHSIIDNEYIGNNIDYLYRNLNTDNLQQAEDILKIFDNIELDNTLKKTTELARGIIYLRKEDYIEALNSFNRATPLKEALIGIACCKLNIRNASDLKESNDILDKIDNNFSSDIYIYFNSDYIKALNIYEAYWAGDDISYYDELIEIEKKALRDSNPLIDNIIMNIEQQSLTMKETVMQDIER